MKKTNNKSFTILKPKEQKELMDNILSSYAHKPVDVQDVIWLEQELNKYLPNDVGEKNKQCAIEICDILKENAQARQVMIAGQAKGLSASFCLSKSVKEHFKDGISFQSIRSDIGNNTGVLTYLDNIEESISNGNAQLLGTSIRDNGMINHNPQLDGFLAEAHHAATFNIDAAVKDSSYYARVDVPLPGETYAKNSCDITVFDSDNSLILGQYQAKFYKDAHSTVRALEHGDYNNQISLVPSDQVQDINNLGVNATDRLTYGDVNSVPITKMDGKRLQLEAQNGKLATSGHYDFNNSIQNPNIIVDNIVKKAASAGVLGATIAGGFELASQVYEKYKTGKSLDVEKIVGTAIETGADTGIKAATAGAIKIGAEKGFISGLKGASSGAVATIAFIAVENLKVIKQVIDNKIPASKAFAKMGENTACATVGYMMASKGASVGASLGAALGPVGATIGGFVGGCVGYAAGSSVGSKVVSTVKHIAKSACSFVSYGCDKVVHAAKNIVSSIASFLGF